MRLYLTLIYTPLSSFYFSIFILFCGVPVNCIPLQLYRKIAVTCSYSHSDLFMQKFVLFSRELIKEVFSKYELEMRWSLTI